MVRERKLIEIEVKGAKSNKQAKNIVFSIEILAKKIMLFMKTLPK